MIRLWVLLLAVLCLNACGFHLRGQTPLSPALQQVAIRSNDPYGPLTTRLKQSLVVNGSTISSDASSARTILELQREVRNQVMLSVGSTLQTRQYRLSLSVRFRILDPDGKVILPWQIVTEIASITTQANYVLAGSNEADNMIDDLRQSLVSDILYRLTAPKTQALLKNVE